MTTATEVEPKAYLHKKYTEEEREALYDALQRELLGLPVREDI